MTKGNEWLLLKHGTAMKAIPLRKIIPRHYPVVPWLKIAGSRSPRWTSGQKAKERDAGGKAEISFKRKIAGLARKKKTMKAPGTKKKKAA